MILLTNFGGKLKTTRNIVTNGEVVNFCFLDNWTEVCEEICRSNIIQRDNLKFARKLNKDLVKLAKERSVLVSPRSKYFHINQFTFRPKMMIFGLSEPDER